MFYIDLGQILYSTKLNAIAIRSIKLWYTTVFFFKVHTNVFQILQNSVRYAVCICAHIKRYVGLSLLCDVIGSLFTINTIAPCAQRATPMSTNHRQWQRRSLPRETCIYFARALSLSMRWLPFENIYASCFIAASWRTHITQQGLPEKDDKHPQNHRQITPNRLCLLGDPVCGSACRRPSGRLPRNCPSKWKPICEEGVMAPSTLCICWWSAAPIQTNGSVCVEEYSPRFLCIVPDTMPAMCGRTWPIIILRRKARVARRHLRRCVETTVHIVLLLLCLAAGVVHWPRLSWCTEFLFTSRFGCPQISLSEIVEPLDYEDFLIQHSSLLCRDALRNILDFPPADVLVRTIPRKIRTVEYVVPKEDM